MWTLLILILVATAVSGWTITFIKNREATKDKELVALQSSFAKQYGTDGITVTQLVSPDKVYAAVWTDKDGLSHVSWNIGGIWVTVYSGDTEDTTAIQGE